MGRCPGPRTVTAPAVPKLIPNGRQGVSIWVEIRRDHFAVQRPTERWLQSRRLSGLDLAVGPVTDGRRRIEPLFTRLYQALGTRHPQSAFVPADETRWSVVGDTVGKTGHGWWL
jgi:transposase